ncbi:uncharacterized protein SCHCODRAFT_02639100 [Schizophyllum commune H4-8]|uniref:uncharacterized protein n=1 Tax=Schizophyllum commune (strain H4-8 / FGSC 9210) TaxID=578458 RepID=UPI00215F4D00|nr:uncharacterized protein SCHCODRAFT_02639100 [Schizophyllum commune H4-8]KAI5887868.1 hypothetical protein SCHCODRAFT_02639100 [Schizophyllum commune H4-8]
MHRALLIPEVIATVCSLSHRKDVRNMSKVCHAWRDQALDHLWKTLARDALDKLFSTLPREVYRRKRQFPVLRNRIFTVQPRWVRPPSQDEYDQLYTITSRIQVLRVLSNRQLIDMLVRHPPANPLFPRLTDLSVYILCDDVVHDEELTPFSSTVLSKLRVSLTPSEKKPRLDIDALCACCASDVLITLAVFGLRTMPNIVGVRKDVLRQLDVDDLNDEGYAVAAALPALETLRIVTPREDPPSFTKLSSVGRPFHALRTLELRAAAYKGSPYRGLIANFLRHCGILTLSTLTIDLDLPDVCDGERRPTDHWHELFQALASHCYHESLRHLDVRDGSELAVLDGDDIRMLLPFTHLETVSLENRGGIAISNSHIVSLMQAWPSLQTLSLVQPMEDASLADDAEDLVDSDGEALEKIDTPVVYTCTVLGLLEIARRATSLHALTLSVDFSDIPQQLGDRPFDNNVTSLELRGGQRSPEGRRTSLVCRVP